MYTLYTDRVQRAAVQGARTGPTYQEVPGSTLGGPIQPREAWFLGTGRPASWVLFMAILDDDRSQDTVYGRTRLTALYLVVLSL